MTPHSMLKLSDSCRVWLPRWHSGKESTCHCRRHKRHGFDPQVGKIALEQEMATHCSILAWKIPWREESGGLLSNGVTESDATERVRVHTHTHIHSHVECMDKLFQQLIYFSLFNNTGFESILEGLYGPRLRRDLSLFEGNTS